MKNYRMLLPIGMIFLMVVSWYMLISESVEVEDAYGTYLESARAYAADGLTKYAIENYNYALEIKSEPDIYVEVADYYKEQKRYGDYVSWCENFYELYPTDVKAYDCILDAYLCYDDYKECFEVLDTASKRGISSEYIEKVRKEIQYTYRLDYTTFEDVGMYSNNFCPISSNGLWGFVDRYGNVKIACIYKQVSGYTQSGFSSVVTTGGEAYFIDKSNAKVKVSKEKYQSFGLIVGGLIAAQCEDGTYTYLNEKLETLFGKYDYASTINADRGAVCKDGKWQIINGNGEKIIEEEYVDVKLDEKQISYRNNRAFVAKTDGTYVMIDETGKQIGVQAFEDAKVFASSAPAAVKVNGEWCFVDANGERISNKTYDDARSYSNGLAAVKINGKWGFVDLEENIVIEPKFYDAKDFNELGSCFVKTGDKWQLLKLYSLNRE